MCGIFYPAISRITTEINPIIIPKILSIENFSSKRKYPAIRTVSMLKKIIITVATAKFLCFKLKANKVSPIP